MVAVGLLRAPFTGDAQRALLGIMHDPGAAAGTNVAGVGARITVELVGRSGIDGEAPLHGTFEMRALSALIARTFGRSDLSPKATGL